LTAPRATSDAPDREDRYGRIEHALSTGIGARLREAREAAGMSQQDLGVALGYKPTMISAFENGRRRMKVEDLTRACIVLGKEPEYFLQTGSLRPVASVGLALRAEVASIPQDDLRESLGGFLDAVDQDQLPTGAVPDLHHLRPEAAAQEILKLAGATEPPVQMEEICKALSIPLYHCDDFPDALSALVLTIADGSYVIGVNGDHHSNRRRFSEAHELGHAVLRHEASYYLEYNAEGLAGEPPGYRYLDEREANSFAAALLMDERWVRQDFANGMRSVDTLAFRYQVSPVAMSFRLVNLGLT
jgi:transcriptional regulator with XRE-family HTH domain